MNFISVADGPLSQSVRKLGWRPRSLVGGTKGKEIAAEMEDPSVDLNLIMATTHHGCIGLPQELVDCVTELLSDDLPALKACSLTCKALFASTRHLIHETLRLNIRNNQSVLSREEKLRYLRWNCRDTELRFLTYAGEHGLLRYARRVHICMPYYFTPDLLLPHLHHFQSLNNVHALTIEHCLTVTWSDSYKTSFLHFYPTLTSLTLHYPSGDYRFLLQFVLQFPNLENLALEWLEELVRQDFADPVIIHQTPPLRGHFRLAGVRGEDHWPMDFSNDLRHRIFFRSVELEDCLGDKAQYVLNACAHTIEHLILVPRGIGTHRSRCPQMSAGG